MKILKIKIHDPAGIHARNALLLSNLATRFLSTISIKKGERIENAKKLMVLMTMRVKYGDMVSFIIKGADESEAFLALKEFCEKSL